MHTIYMHCIIVCIHYTIFYDCAYQFVLACPALYQDIAPHLANTLDILEL